MKPDIIYEVSWETCNKVGGIYTVLRSKAAQMVHHYGERYVVVGPFFDLERLKGEFEELPMPDICKTACSALPELGIRLHWGRWLVPGSPRALLIDFSEYLSQANDIKRQLWDAYQIDSLNTGDEVNHPLVWSWCAGMVIDALAKEAASASTVAHFHEWLSGAGLLYLAKEKSPVKTVFTTHATMVGRSLASSGVPLYDDLEKFNATEEAYRLGVATKHLLEKASATHASVLTTVSEITGTEVQYFLERKPDYLLPNGLDMGAYPTLEEIAIRHRVARDQMREFLFYYFLPYYTLDISNTLFYFISGRYEVRNKGIDMYIWALKKLNEELKKKKDAKTIISFLFIPTEVRAIYPALIEQREQFRDMQRMLQEVHDTLVSNVMFQAFSRKSISLESLLGDERSADFQKKIKKFKRTGTPPIATHELADENDYIIKLLREAGLANAPEDKVKVIYYPIYMNGGDGILNLEYREVIEGSHFGVFPSFYEPWGYTPLETAALGVASLTTDMSGFGQFIVDLRKANKIPDKSPQGIYVLERNGHRDEQIVQDLTAMMAEFEQFSRDQRVENKIAARRVAEQADWKELVTYYFQAHQEALQK